MLNTLIAIFVVIVLCVLLGAFAWDVYKSLPKDKNSAAK